MTKLLNHQFFFRPPLLLLGLLLFLTAQSPKRMSLEQILRESRWKYRVLLIAAPTAEHPDFKTQKALLAAKKTDLAERDFVVVEALYDQLSATDKAFLKSKTGVQPPQFAAVLIGKDGGVKERSRRPIPPADLFGTVDKMPMRQQEMRRK
ncbi:DUF4174 domain-containing protein [Hymenobacter sp. BT683]|uniref:DUF4174 domain-containing protein n=1 Tax=Hymenobacter jeongseonensis TaxID=2791027 RepID=A0ABS0IFA7_9BACT|nr:DUF4174 domain-containing protein [Hymenobacter jeongseonensis]MBF9236510.1 DUF4174 domain-containing protein [Hymenobacter jeongseonensis]